MIKRLSDTIWQSDEAEARRLCESASELWIAQGFKAVLCPAFNVRIPYHAGIAALLLPVRDESEPPPEMYDQAIRFHKAFGPTLVHCHGGKNRSSAFAAALLVAEGMTLEKALDTVIRMPWPGLVSSLKRWTKR